MRISQDFWDKIEQAWDNKTEALKWSMRILHENAQHSDVSGKKGSAIGKEGFAYLTNLIVRRLAETDDPQTFKEFLQALRWVSSEGKLYNVEWTKKEVR